MGVYDRNKLRPSRRQAGPGLPSGPAERRRADRRADAGVAGNARLTAANAAVLVVLLVAEGVTIVSVRQLISLHVSSAWCSYRRCWSR